MRMLRSAIPVVEFICPMEPVQAPLEVPSRWSIIDMLIVFGQPVIEPPGNREEIALESSDPCATSPSTVETR